MVLLYFLPMPSHPYCSKQIKKRPKFSNFIISMIDIYGFLDFLPMPFPTLMFQEHPKLLDARFFNWPPHFYYSYYSGYHKEKNLLLVVPWPKIRVNTFLDIRNKAIDGGIVLCFSKTLQSFRFFLQDLIGQRNCINGQIATKLVVTEFTGRKWIIIIVRIDNFSNNACWSFDYFRMGMDFIHCCFKNHVIKRDL